MPIYVTNQQFAAYEQATLPNQSAETQERPATARLASGGFVTAWVSAGSLITQMFDADGREIGSEIVIYSEGESFQPAIVGLPDGGYAVGYSTIFSGIKVQLFNASGTASGAAFRANPGENVGLQPSLTALSDGNLAVAWYTSGSPSKLEARIFQPSGAAVSDVFVIATGHSMSTNLPVVTALADGTFVATWSGEFTSNQQSTVYAQLYDGSGQVVGPTQHIEAPIVGPYESNFSQSVAALADGGFVMTWTHETFDRKSVQFQVFSAGGTPVGPVRQIDSALSGSQPAVAALDNGGFVVTWQAATIDGGPNYSQQGDIHAQVFDASGAAVGAVFVANSVTEAGQGVPVITGFGTNDFALVWQTFSPSGDSDVAIRQFYSTILGTVGADTLNGTAGPDFIIGAAGADILSGGDGDDTFEGGMGNDTIEGGEGTDTLTGGAGDDTFRDTAGGLDGDTITDFEVGDRIFISDATLAGFTFSLSGGTLTYAGGSLTLRGVGGTLVASEVAGGGVQLLRANDTRDDFNGDGRSDVLWRHETGSLTNWLGAADGGFVANSLYAEIPTDWTVVGTGDFNGDAMNDVLWRHDTGAVTDWLGHETGGFLANNAFMVQVAVEWNVVGTGDYNGDGNADILWRDNHGTLTNWLGHEGGGFIANSLTAHVPTDWQVAGSADFNGDGRDDVLWRHETGAVTSWLAQETGGFAANNGLMAQVPTDWRVIGTGDFDGDGMGDVLWRHETGSLTNWLGQADGGFVANSLYNQVPMDWHIAATGDYNGDGRDDVLWRHDSGAVTDWLAQETGGFAANNSLMAQVSTDWEVQSPDGWWL